MKEEMADQACPEQKEEKTMRSHAIDLPDVVERTDAEALLHLTPADGNALDGQDGFMMDDTLDGLQDLFADDESEEVDIPENISGGNLADSAMSIHDKEIALALAEESNVCEEDAAVWLNGSGKGKRKGKKKGKKKTNRFEEFDFTVEDWDDAKDVKDADRFQSVDECLLHFFSAERVTWRCAKEFPEKSVRFSKEPPEVYVLPPCKESRGGNWKMYLDDDEFYAACRSDEEDTNTLEAQPEAKNTFSVFQLEGVKSCLKKGRPVMPAVPPLNSTKQYFLWSAPKVLCIHLKRFEAMHRRRISKLNHAVRFDLKLDISAFMDPDSPNTPPTYAHRSFVCF